ncbi:Retrovirus-related Pol polyprotein from transposon TNT 1-94 [Vitis vinifera]|uniref:Retrovirus-related Pol polyprotein from transposon TNT 1-94 n=1 Tax=Vitis vinifera TaxID=29760 RepID=A0A438IVL1_VITVI|nr:Retrovirus-related Pol polyprotein from transposon TNT 1-94 [Vitis vinifera]
MVEEAKKASGIEKFDGTDFTYWRMQIEDYLYGRKLHLPLLGTKPKNMKAEEWALLDRQVLGVIRLTLSRSVAHNVVKEKTTADLMKALSGMYEKSFANNKVHLMKKLFNLKMVENASVEQHLNEFNTITNQLSSVEIDFDDDIRALIVLASFPNSWEAMRMAVSNSTGKEKLKYNDIQDLILVEEIHRRDASETSRFGSALNLETRGKGASFHTTPHREIIQNYATSDFGKVYLAHGSALNVVSLGDVQILLPNGSVWLLEKVRHIPDLRRNLISVGQLDDEGHAILLVGGTWKVTKGAGVLPCGKKTGTPYMTLCPRDTIAVADAINLMQSLKYVFSLAMVMRNLAIGGEENKENVNPQVDLSTPVAEVRRSSKNIRPPQCYSHVLNYLLLTYGGEPECYDEALQDENSSKWELAMKDEMNSLLGNQTWELTELSIEKKALHNK